MMIVALVRRVIEDPILRWCAIVFCGAVVVFALGFLVAMVVGSRFALW